MTDFQKYNSTTHPIIRMEDDYNNLLDHGLEKGASYIIRVNGSYYEAVKGGATTLAGTVSFGGSSNAGSVSGTDAEAVFAACYTAILTTGGIIFVKAGTYTFTTGATISTGYNISFIGESAGSNFAEPNTARTNRKQCVKIKSSAVTTLFTLSKCSNITFENIAFSGEDVATSNGILATDCHGIDVHKCYFMGFTACCIKFVGSANYSGDNWVTKNTFSLGDNNVTGAVGVGFQGKYHAATPYPSENTLIFNNNFYSYTTKGTAVKFYEPTDGLGTGAMHIDSIRIKENNIQFMDVALDILGDDGSFVDGNLFENNTLDIYIHGTYKVKTRFMNNHNTDPAVPITITNTNASVENNPYWRDNPGYITENWNLAYSNSATTLAVAHGLNPSAADVANIHVWCQSANGDPLTVTNITATHFTITTIEKLVEKTGYETNKGDAADIAHGLGVTPTFVFLSPATVTSGAKVVLMHWAGAVANATTFRIAINDTSNNTIASGIDFAWRAGYVTTPKLYTVYWYAKIWSHT